MAILTITLNPAIDLETATPQVAAGEKLRCAEPARDPGGGGINVARAIVQLGGQATALVAAGGALAPVLDALMAARGIMAERLPAPGEVRQNLSVIEGATGRQYRFIFPGPVWASSDWAAARAALRARVAPGDWAVVSGSLPVATDGAAMVDLLSTLAGQGARVVVDTSGAALTAVAKAELDLALLRIDREEAEHLAGRALPLPADTADFAASLVTRKAARIVIVARGAEGSVLAAAEGRWRASAAQVQVVSRTGAGDSFVAGAVLALSRGMALPEALRHGTASASAAVMTPATDLCDEVTMRSLIEHCPVTPI